MLEREIYLHFDAVSQMLKNLQRLHKLGYAVHEGDVLATPV